LYLNKFGKNKYSQNGEDGIIEIILSKLNIYNFDKCLCVEFGAWDGKLYSNTFNLVEKVQMLFILKEINNVSKIFS
jgi:hypothetical protein